MPLSSARLIRKAQIQDLWEKVLFGQVHDNIDGSAMEEVYRDAATDYADIRARAEKFWTPR